MPFDPRSRALLSRHDLARFPGDTLFERIGRAVCEAECLPRKELFESWAVARRVQRRITSGRVLDLAAGHGLIASLLLLIDPSRDAALALDERLPRSAERVRDALSEHFPRLRGRVSLREAPLYEARAEPGDCVVSVHACGALTDRVLELAVAARARVAVLPCCHDADTCDTGALTGWLDVASAIDATRALTLRAAGYHVHTQTIAAEITPKNRLLIGVPA